MAHMAIGLLAANGEALTPEEYETFREVTGGRPQAPTKRTGELWCCVGRRGGKSRVMAARAVYEAGLVDHSAHLSRGEKGLVSLQAPDMSQARTLLEYCQGALEATPMLRQSSSRIASVTSWP